VIDRGKTGGSDRTRQGNVSANESDTVWVAVALAGVVSPAVVSCPSYGFESGNHDGSSCLVRKCRAICTYKYGKWLTCSSWNRHFSSPAVAWYSDYVFPLLCIDFVSVVYPFGGCSEVDSLGCPLRCDARTSMKELAPMLSLLWTEGRPSICRPSHYPFAARPNLNHLGTGFVEYSSPSCAPWTNLDHPGCAFPHAADVCHHHGHGKTTHEC
jgi:hypothetical protein